MRDVIDRMTERWMALVPECPRSMVIDKPVVTFTFDDFPRTAWTSGGKILEDAGFRATYFASAAFSRDRMGIARPFGALEGSIAYYETEDLVDLVDHGHELGCHTFEHLRVPTQSSAELSKSIHDNAEYFRRILGSSFAFRSFAYPQGAANFRTRKSLSRLFRSCRGTYHGVNRGLIDVAYLRSLMIDREFDPHKRILQIIERSKRFPSWIIFCLHDVQPKPSRWGCEPGVLKTIVNEVQRAGIEVATIDQVTTRYMDL